jgi:[ribosomal protein S18]-alanine N-acetyltransferase
MIAISCGDARDIPEIMPIMETAFDPTYGESWTSAQCLSLLAMPGSRLLIAYLDNKAVGFALSRWVLEEEELLMIGVVEAMQNKKIGTRLLNDVIQRAQNNNRLKLYLEVRDNNPAKDFYLSFGFEKIGYRKNYYQAKDGQYRDAITMMLKT